MREHRIRYPIPSQTRVERTADLTYRTVEGRELALDLYRPSGTAGLLPVVVFVHGDGPPDVIRDIKDWGQYTSWAELMASKGFAAATFNHRSSHQRTRMADVAGDIDSALEYLDGNAEKLGLDVSRVGLWSCSMGVPFAVRAAFERRSSIRCIAVLYGPMDLEHDSGADESVSLEQKREFSPLYHLRNGRVLPPLFVARAGMDHPLLNESISAFVTSALERNTEIEVVNHPTGEHGFDVLDDSPSTRGVIDAVLGFFETHL
jgi:acetyl esterase/lipase